MPSSARPTTASPVTAPPRNAMDSAFSRPSFAAFAVLTFARTETFMPMYPANADAAAPTRNPKAIFDPSPPSNSSIAAGVPCSKRIRRALSPSNVHIAAASMIATIATVLYWRFRYAIAPSCIAAAISCISFVPEGCFKTRYANTPANTRLIMPATGARYNMLSISNYLSCLYFSLYFIIG
uniref:Uncharacterized protein n=1 Tax=Candidatus Methanogaster sp. ANME-2c ERB4 TaxID=2759911 RepID=A0A7G9Y6J8_9EURY|nr:hypothetical protein MOOKMAHM_00001 [Methanosarcinales archaeon ANME-2c ERB4]